MIRIASAADADLGAFESRKLPSLHAGKDRRGASAFAPRAWLYLIVTREFRARLPPGGEPGQARLGCCKVDTLDTCASRARALARGGGMTNWMAPAARVRLQEAATRTNLRLTLSKTMGNFYYSLFPDSPDLEITPPL